MFLKNVTKKYTESYSEQINKLKEKIINCDSIIVGAGAGLSASAGFEYSGKRFDEHFSDFKEKYHFNNMYSGGFYPYNTLEEYWAYWARYIYINRYCDIPKPVYKDLLDIVKDKDYFVITTNVDHCFQKAGFDKNRLFYTQGDYGLFQCSEPCCDETYDNEKIIRKMVNSQENMRIPSELVPYCPKCGKPMTMNLRADDTFVQDIGWYKASKKYSDFLEKHRNSKILLFELGVGYNTPAIIKYNFWRITIENKNAFYSCLNFGDAFCPDDIKNSSICINNDIGYVLKGLKLKT